MSNAPFVLAAGGTGGHLFPAEALARELLARGRKVALITDQRGGSFAVAGVTTYQIPAGRFSGGILAKAKGLFDLARGFFSAHRLLIDLQPAVVIGFGGYPSLPTVLAANRQHLPTLLHDQNAVMGRANRLLAPHAARIACQFATLSGLKEADRGKLVRTGNPVRPAIAALRDTPYQPPDAAGPLRLLIVGGSQGARILSRVVPAALLALPEPLRNRLQISQQVRAEDSVIVEAAYRDSSLNRDLRRFFDDMEARLAAAHLVIGRAGGSTTAELTVSGRPSILVPFAAAIADEQSANARILADNGAAWILSENEFDKDSLAALLTRLLQDPAALARAAAAARDIGIPDAAARLADLAETLEKSVGEAA